MVNYDLIAAIIFYGLILIYFFTHRKRFEIQAKVFAIYRTKLGLRFMDRVARVFPRVWKIIGIISLLTGFFGMVIIIVLLTKATLDLIFVPGAIPSVAPLLPGIKLIPGLPAIPFWDWVISIFIVAVVHEAFHGIFSRVYNIKVKSSGFAFLGPLLGAFVEPDERQMAKKSKAARLSILSAGPFANILSVVVIVFLFGLNITLPGVFGSGPISVIPHSLTAKTSIVDMQTVIEENYEFKALVIEEIENGTAAYESGLVNGDKIIGINNILVSENVSKFFDELLSIKSGERVNLVTNKGDVNLVAGEHPENKSRGYMGFSALSGDVGPKDSLKEKYKAFSNLPLRFMTFLNWLLLISLAVGLFNLLPLGPLDGGKMFYNLFLGIVSKRNAQRLWMYVSIFCLTLLLINLMPFLFRFLSFIFKPLI